MRIDFPSKHHSNYDYTAKQVYYSVEIDSICTQFPKVTCQNYKNQLKPHKNQFKPIKTKKTWFLYGFFGFFNKNHGFWFF